MNRRKNVNLRCNVSSSTLNFKLILYINYLINLMIILKTSIPFKYPSLIKYYLKTKMYIHVYYKIYIEINNGEV